MKTLLFAALGCASGVHLKVAFVGNSYTYYQDLPGLLAELAASEGDHVEHGQNTPGGSALWEHADATMHGRDTGRLLTHNDWDFIVMQDQSQSPGGGRVTSGTALPAGEAKARGEKALREFFIPRLRGARAVLYSTWGRRDGDSANKNIFPTFEAMNMRTNEGYEDYKKVFDHQEQPALVIPAGEAFEMVHQDTLARKIGGGSNSSAVEFKQLYYSQVDGSHPSMEGTYLVACLFYAKLFPNKGLGSLNFHPAAISDANAEYLRRTAERAIAAADSRGMTNTTSL